MAAFNSIAPMRRTAVSRAVLAQFPVQKISTIPEPLRIPAYKFILAVAAAQHGLRRPVGKLFPGVPQ